MGLLLPHPMNQDNLKPEFSSGSQSWITEQASTKAKVHASTLVCTPPHYMLCWITKRFLKHTKDLSFSIRRHFFHRDKFHPMPHEVNISVKNFAAKLCHPIFMRQKKHIVVFSSFLLGMTNRTLHTLFKIKNLQCLAVTFLESDIPKYQICLHIQFFYGR